MICTTLALLAPGAKDADLVDRVPGFDKAPFKVRARAPPARPVRAAAGDCTGTDYTAQVYSGFLDVKGPVAGYDSLSIHYEFHESMNAPASDPVVTWHQGGPGGSSLYGAYGEMGYFQVALDDKGNLTHFTNDYSWNRVANMLYLEDKLFEL